MIEFLLLACLGGLSGECRTDQMLLTDMTLVQCNNSAQLLAAGWSADHPDWWITRIECRPVGNAGTKA